MIYSDSPEHSKADIIRTALQYSCSKNEIDFLSLQREVRAQVDSLFSEAEEAFIHVHTDARRSIYEYNWVDFSLQRFEVHSRDVPLGNHYHRKSRWYNTLADEGSNKLSEMFVFDEWAWLLLLQELDSEWVTRGKLEEFSVRARDVLVIHPLQVHTLYLDPGTKFRWFRPYPFDEIDMDMNSYKLERRKK